MAQCPCWLQRADRPEPEECRSEWYMQKIQAHHEEINNVDTQQPPIYNKLILNTKPGE